MTPQDRAREAPEVVTRISNWLAARSLKDHHFYRIQVEDLRALLALAALTPQPEAAKTAREVLGDPTVSVGGAYNPATGLVEPFVSHPPQPEAAQGEPEVVREARVELERSGGWGKTRYAAQEVVSAYEAGLSASKPAASVPDLVGVRELGLEPYIPTPIYFEDSDALEFVSADVPFITRRMDENWSLLLDMATREPIGFRLEAPRRAFADALEALAQGKGSPAQPEGAWRPDGGKLWSLIRSRLMDASEAIAKADRYEKASVLADDVARNLADEILALTTEPQR